MTLDNRNLAARISGTCISNSKVFDLRLTIAEHVIILLKF